MPDIRPFADSSAEHLRSVIEAGQIGIWELDLQSGRAVRNARHDEIFGYRQPLSDWTYEMFLDHVVEADRHRVDRLQKTAIANGVTWAFECRIKTADREERWISAAGRPLNGPDGQAEKLIGHVIDITSAKLREARLKLLTDELNHRVRNMLTMISSMVTMSAAKATDIGSFSKALEGRVDALARSHQLLFSEAPASMLPSTILDVELSAFPSLRERARIEISDEPQLHSATAQGLALVFHELLTNALKYGAFSNEEGSVDVQIRGSEGGIEIEWKERNGPEVSVNRKPGFGSTLISRALGPDAQVELEYAGQGLECRIKLVRG